MNAAFVLVTAAWLAGADAAPAAPAAPAAAPAAAAPAAPAVPAAMPAPAMPAPAMPLPAMPAPAMSAPAMPAPAISAAPMISGPTIHAAPGASCGSCGSSCGSCGSPCGSCGCESCCEPEKKKGFCAHLKAKMGGGKKDSCEPKCEEPKQKSEKGGLFHHKKKKKEESCDCCGEAVPHGVLMPHAAPMMVPSMPMPAPTMPMPHAEIIGTPKAEGQPMPLKASQAPAEAELAPTSSKVIETETKHPFELSRRYEARVDRATDYSWITGQLFYVHADGGLWVLRYAPIGQEDPNGGGVILARNRQMDSYREGDLVQVKGEILKEQRSLYLGAPLYRAQEIQLMDRQE